MRLKCLFCKYKPVCLPEMEDGLTKYHKLQNMYKEVVQNYNELSENYNLRYNLEQFIKKNEPK